MYKYFIFVLTLIALPALAATKPIVVTSRSPEFTITLKSNPTTGYSWFLKDYNSSVLKPISQKYHPPKKTLPGAGGSEVWKFKVNPQAFAVPQITKIELVYARPWEASSGEDEDYTIIIKPN